MAERKLKEKDLSTVQTTLGVVIWPTPWLKTCKGKKEHVREP